MSAVAELPAMPPAVSPSAPAPLRFGKLLDEPIDVYHGGDAISKTRLDTFRYSPRLFWKKHVAKLLPKEPPSDNFIIGGALDALALEGPEEFARRYVLPPLGAPKRPTKAQLNAKNPSAESVHAIKFWANFDQENAGKVLLDADHMDVVRRCADALHGNETFQKLLQAGRSQVTFRLRGERFAMQCRPDIWCEDGCELTDGMPCIVDLKTVHSLPCDDPEGLMRHIAEYGYHRGAWLYREIVSLVMGYKDGYRPPFILAFVEKAEPHAVVCLTVDDVALGIGDRETSDALKKLRQCYDTNHWPETWEKPLATIGLPQFYIRRALETVEPNLF